MFLYIFNISDAFVPSCIVVSVSIKRSMDHIIPGACPVNAGMFLIKKMVYLLKSMRVRYTTVDFVILTYLIA